MTFQPTSYRERKAAGERLAMLTAYDYPTARILDESGVDLLLVGDSLGMVVMGHPDTTSVTLEDILHHSRMVVRGSARTPVVADMPIGTVDTVASGMAAARRLMDAGVQAVKLEGGAEFAGVVRAMVDAGIPVMGHVGMLPQRVVQEGGYRIKGRTELEGERLIADGIALQEAGAFAVVLELVHAPIAERMSAALAIPTIGIGSGPGCDGQVLVTHDLIGLFPWFTPKFVRSRERIAERIGECAASFADEVRKPFAPAGTV